MIVKFSRKICCGNARCAEWGPDFYKLDDMGYCRILPVNEVPKGLEQQARDGAANCPEKAITIED